jgi:hypothetical protein
MRLVRIFYAFFTQTVRKTICAIERNKLLRTVFYKTFTVNNLHHTLSYSFLTAPLGSVLHG